jgi:elongator complex protein 3
MSRIDLLKLIRILGHVLNKMEEIVDQITKGNVKTRKDLEKLKRKYGTFSNAEILGGIKRPTSEIRKLLQTKPTRSLSGVSVVAVMARPEDCPHGRCVMCPRGRNSPQSYTGHEPAAMRAKRNKFDPVSQVQNRLDQYHATGHTPNKVELIVMGGTFPSFKKDFQEHFVERCLSAMNTYPKKPGRSSLSVAQERNEKSKSRCVGMTFETRPDYCDTDWLLHLGCTRVELGVQSLDNRVLRGIKRGHTVEQSIAATKDIKDSGLKVCYHMMAGLPGSNQKKDLETFKKLFSDQRFRPDMLKIYPTIVCEGTELYDMWKDGKYKPYSEDELVRLLMNIKKTIPEYVRIMRIQRDIPTHQIVAGPKHTNIRESLKGCRCIRCRQAKGEVGDYEISVRKYKASDGEEYFISAEGDELYGFCRLRVCDRNFVRELHVYGEQASIGSKGKVQHKGIGKQLLQRAEEIADGRIYVTSGIGAREYYRKLGYRRKGFYMFKR